MKNKETSSGSPPVYENSVSMLPMLRYTIFRNLQFYSESLADVMCSMMCAASDRMDVCVCSECEQAVIMIDVEVIRDLRYGFFSFQIWE